VGLIFWTSAFHRKKKDDTVLPRQFGYNMPLELVLTVTPFLIISVLFYFTCGGPGEDAAHRQGSRGRDRHSRPSSGTGSSATSGSISRTAR